MIKSVLEVLPHMPLCKASVPDTDFVIVPPSHDWPRSPARIEKAGVFESDLTRRMIQRFGHLPVNVKTLRRIAGWLREGSQ